MYRPRVYVETTIPSFYFDERQAPEIVECRRLTRKWWHSSTRAAELVTGATVLRELMEGPAERQVEWLGLMSFLPVLRVSQRVLEIAEAYIRHKLMPAPPSKDALHLALACYYHCEALVTWDTRHLANPNKMVHRHRINTRLGLHGTEVLTPRDFLERLG